MRRCGSSATRTTSRSRVALPEVPAAFPQISFPDRRRTTARSSSKRRLLEADVESFGVRVHGEGEYPERLRDAAQPVDLLYYQAWWALTYSCSIAVVGTRKPSREGALAHAPARPRTRRQRGHRRRGD